MHESVNLVFVVTAFIHAYVRVAQTLQRLSFCLSVHTRKRMLAFTCMHVCVCPHTCIHAIVLPKCFAREDNTVLARTGKANTCPDYHSGCSVSQFIILQKPITMTKADVAALDKVQHKNYRLPQPLNARTLQASN